MRIGIIAVILFFLLLLPIKSHAETSTNSGTITPKSTFRETRENIKTRMQDARMEFKEKREELRDTVMEKRKEAQSRFKDLREQFKERLASITAEKKKIVVEHIDEKMTSINTKRTDHMTDVLEKLSGILGRIEKKASEAAARDVDTTTVDAAINDAHDAIDAAQTAVIAQAGKDYVINLGDENAIKNAVGKTISGLQKDLRDTHKLVVDARQAVMKAAMELEKTIGKNKLKEHTASAEAE